ncbi:hypothetical protein [Bowmanella yangjiangensis]|uniref:Lipoprotein n=1 Tax=Bowmanella yangjiangensis TaxID=2811230 RepID=A0ABS3CU65_9ALTE|nr:hypothetical protein [Bowmanella yangjiangensis]MBN7819971.1 hypothetical protein [Bowmanella yangjiangensis]
MLKRPLLLCSSLLALSACQPSPQTTQQPQEQQTSPLPRLEDQVFYQQSVDVFPYLPADLSEPYIDCPLTVQAPSEQYQSAAQTDYATPGWEQRIAADWQFFGNDSQNGRLLVIDHRLTENDLSYRYLANGNSQNELYEPWSSSKVMAFTGAVSKARQSGVGANSLAGDVPIADLITSIHTYFPFGMADGNSNAIASYFINVSGRDYLTSLFHDAWLKLSNPNIFMRGAYGSVLFDPGSDTWQDRSTKKSVSMSRLTDNQQDPGYLPYRCDNCGLTGNKPMTTLAQAEWLKRLASHVAEPTTRHPGLEEEDIRTLFYGVGHSDVTHQYGGMLMGISNLLADAIAKQIDGPGDSNSKLNQISDGKWRIFQKLGSGPSETRKRAEMVMLAQVCLPDYQGGRAFTLAAQAGVDGDEEWQVNQAAMKLQALLDNGMATLLARP